MLFSIASADGNTNTVELKNEIAELMTPEQIANAQVLAREWMENH